MAVRAAAASAAGSTLTCSFPRHPNLHLALEVVSFCCDHTRRLAAAGGSKPSVGPGSGAAADGKAVGAAVKRSYKNGVAHVVNVPPCSPVSLSLCGRNELTTMYLSSSLLGHVSAFPACLTDTDASQQLGKAQA